MASHPLTLRQSLGGLSGYGDTSADRGDLLTHVMKKKKLPEDEARFLFQQLCIGLNYLHCENIVHRDLKVCARSALPCLCGAVVVMALIQSL